MRIVTFFKRSKEKRPIKYVKKLRNILLDLGYKRPNSGSCSMINIIEFGKDFNNKSSIEWNNMSKSIEF